MPRETQGPGLPGLRSGSISILNSTSSIKLKRQMAIAAPDGSTRWQGVALGPGDDCVRSGGRWQLQPAVFGLIAGYRLKGFGAPLLVVERQLQMNLPVYTLVHS